MNNTGKKLFLIFLLIIFCSCSQKATYTVSFNSDGGTFVEAKSVVQGEKVQRPEDPKKEGMTFVEWQLEGTAYDFDSGVEKDITLKAVYDIPSTVTVKDGSRTYTVHYPEDGDFKLADPDVPEGKLFTGWLVDGKEAPLSAVKKGSTIEAIIIDLEKEVACTGIETPYNNYWAIEGTSTYSLEAKFLPEDTTDKAAYRSDDENVVTVDANGNVTPKKPGKTKITITCGGQTRIIGFETRARSVPVEKITFEQDEIYLYLGNTAQIKAKIYPDNATDKTLTYESLDPSIATVDSNGLITAKRPGKVSIYVAGKGYDTSVFVCVEGETVVFEMKNKVSVKAGSGAKIPYKATLIMCYDGEVNKQDVTLECDFHTAYTSALDIDGHGNVYAKGAVFETVDAEVYFTWSDGSSLYCTSPTYVVHVEK